MEKSYERQVYELLDGIMDKSDDNGDPLVIEFLSGDLHMIYYLSDDIIKFKVYHKDGYCFDLIKERYYDPEDADYVAEDYKHFEISDSDGCNYTFNSNWEGFNKINTAVKALKILQYWIGFLNN